jgi:hypothetical protein
MSTKTITAFDLDIRVRDRHIKNGTLSDKDLEKFITGLPDLTDASEPVSLAQPAFASEEDAIDDDEDEDDEEDEEQADAEGEADAEAGAEAETEAEADPAPVASSDEPS